METGSGSLKRLQVVKPADIYWDGIMVTGLLLAAYWDGSGTET